MAKKAGLFLLGLAVVGSTVYALVLRSTREPAAQQPAVQQPAVQPTRAVTPIATETAATPTTWGRLVRLEEPAATEAIADKGFRMTIRTPPIVISGDPRPAPRAVARSAATARPPEDSSGVMARFKAPAPADADEGLPQAPDRAAIKRVMSTVRAEIQECYDRGMVPGKVDLMLTVAGDTGRVVQANVSATSSTATCIQRVARSLEFPRFARDRITVRYPYRFR